jgi:hypothetical protein
MSAAVLSAWTCTAACSVWAVAPARNPGTVRFAKERERFSRTSNLPITLRTGTAAT